MYVCLCRGITDTQIRKAVQSGSSEFRQLKQSLEVGAQCGKCVRMTM
ncbi:MAG: (2Fe-2S)-binding protein, partial [Plesiomonas sp.]